MFSCNIGMFSKSIGENSSYRWYLVSYWTSQSCLSMRIRWWSVSELCEWWRENEICSIIDQRMFASWSEISRINHLSHSWCWWVEITEEYRCWSFDFDCQGRTHIDAGCRTVLGIGPGWFSKSFIDEKCFASSFLFTAPSRLVNDIIRHLKLY